MPQPRRALLRATAVALVLVLASAVGVEAVQEQLAALDEVENDEPSLHVVEGLNVKRFLGETGTRFLAHVRRSVPEGERIQVILPPRRKPIEGTSCEKRAEFGHFWWVAYALAPRPAYCDGSAKYWIYVGVDPVDVPPPAGAEVDVFAPTYAVARVP